MPKITGKLTTTDPADTYAITDDLTHQGGWRPVATITARNNIPIERRSEGMRVLVLSTRIEYQLEVLTALNDQWSVVSTGGSLDFTADLESINGSDVKNGATFKSKYYAVIADNGGGEYYYAASSAETPVPGLVIEPLDGLGRFYRIIPEMIDLRSVGGVVQVDTADHTIGGTFDNSVVFNRTINWCASLFTVTTYNRLQTAIRVPGGNWITHNPIVLKPRVSIHGDGCVFADADSVGPTEASSFNNGPSRIMLADATNCKMFTVDSSTGLVRQQAELLEDGSVHDSRIAQVTLKGLNLYGNGGNQTKFNCDGLDSMYTWGITVDNCAFYNFKGYMIRMRDCNVVRVHNCYGIGVNPTETQFGAFGKGNLLYSNSDTQFYSNEVGGYSGPGIWVSGVSGWLCLIQQNLSFNNNQNRFAITGISGNEITVTVAQNAVPSGALLIIGREYRIIQQTNTDFTLLGASSNVAGTVFTASATGTSLTLDVNDRVESGHVYETGDPIEVGFTFSGGAMVTGLVDSTTYWAIRTGYNKLKVATSYDGALAYATRAVTSGTVTITNASPAVFTMVGHGMIPGDDVNFTTTGGLPTGLTVGTNYVVLSAGLTANTFRVAALAGPLGTVVNTSSAGSGTHTAHIGNRLISGGTLAFVHHGDGSGIYASNDANSLLIAGNRFDQNEDAGASFSRSRNNTITGNLIHLNGHKNYLPYDGTTLPQAGVYFRNVSAYNNTSGNVFGGASTFVYNQGWGVYYDRFCVTGVIGTNTFPDVLTQALTTPPTGYNRGWYIDPNGNSLIETMPLNTQTGLTAVTDASATPFTMWRNDTGDGQQLVLTPGQLKIRNLNDATTPANNGFYSATFAASSAAVTWLLGTPGTTYAPRTGIIQGEPAVAASGSNTPAASLLYISSAGTGIATQGGRHDFYVPVEKVQSVVTINNSSPAAATMTWPVHGFAAGDPFTVQTTGTLPAGMLPDTLYYTLASGLTADTFTFSATFGGSPVVTSTAGSGVHTATSGFSGESTAQSTTVRFRVGRQTVALPTRTNNPTVLNGSDFYWDTRQNFGFYHDAINARHTMSQPNKLGTLHINTEVPTVGTTVTLTLGTPLVVNWTSHALVANQPLSFSTSGALPKEVTSGQTYYVSATGLGANSFQISVVKGGASITGSGIQTGTHTSATYGAALTVVPTQREHLLLLDVALTANRTVALSSTAAQPGVRWYATRTAASTGAFNWDIGGLINLTAGTWAVIEHNGAAFVVIQSGALSVTGGGVQTSDSPTWTGAHTFSKAGALSLPTIQVTGAPITGGTATTTKPLVLIETAATTSAFWNVNGTMFGVNAPSGHTGSIVRFGLNGVQFFDFTAGGSMSAAGALVAGSNILAGTFLRAGQTSYYEWSGRARMFSPADGVILMQDQAAATFTRLDFGGTTSSFPALERSGTKLISRLADGTDGGIFQAKEFQGSAETTVASATTTDLGAVNSNLVSITGTTTITGFGTIAAGVSREGRFTGILTLTHNATSLILPGGASITTAAGDRFCAVSLGSGNWVVYWYVRASGLPVVSAAGGTKTVGLFISGIHNEPPSSNYATLVYRNNHPVLAFDTTTQETGIYEGYIPEGAVLTAGVTVFARWCAETATSGTIGWDVAFERIADSGLDIDGDSFGTAQTITAATVSGTSGITLVTSVNFSLAQLPASLAVGDMIRIRIRRDVANDSATGDAQLLQVVLQLQ